MELEENYQVKKNELGNSLVFKKVDRDGSHQFLSTDNFYRTLHCKADCKSWVSGLIISKQLLMKSHTLAANQRIPVKQLSNKYFCTNVKSFI